MRDDLGTRMKEKYEVRTQTYLPRRTYAIIRVDGKAFHTWVRSAQCTKPFDVALIEAMNETAIFMCENIQGAQLAYTQSDEISILITDFERENSEAWFDYNVQKMVSISASLATAGFDRSYSGCQSKLPALFDARAFVIPDPVEVENYFIWRQKDAERNSIQSVAQSLYSHKELDGKGCSELNEMIWQKGKNWNNFTAWEKRGRVAIKVSEPKTVEYENPKEGKVVKLIERKVWKTLEDTPLFTADREFLRTVIPHLGYGEKDAVKGK
jgi:tRNA(His) 5'-end guanylyltransferase